MTPTWPSPSQIEQSARALDPEAWAILDSDSIGMMTRRKVSLEQARKALSAVNPYEWMPIETAPKDGTFILTFAGDMAASITDGSWAENVEDSVVSGVLGTWRDDGADPTHWMPLPPSPEGDK